MLWTVTNNLSKHHRLKAHWTFGTLPPHPTFGLRQRMRHAERMAERARFRHKANAAMLRDLVDKGVINESGPITQKAWDAL